MIRVVTRLESGQAEATITQTTQLGESVIEPSSKVLLITIPLFCTKNLTDLAATPPAPNVTTPTASSSVPTETPFYQQAAFIVGMVVLGFVLIFLLLVPIVCVLVRPRGDSTYKPSSPTELGDVSHRYSRMENSPSPKRATPTSKNDTLSPMHAKGSWSPGDPYKDVSAPL